MKISKLALIALLGGALMAFGCSDDTSTPGTGGGGGAVACAEAEDVCSNGTINPITPCCVLDAPPVQENACTGTESLLNPATCTATGTTVTHQLTMIEIAGDCNVGYDLDGCDGNSCRVGSLVAGEGLLGVDNYLAGLQPTLDNLDANLDGVNQAFSDAICGATDADDDPATGEGGCEVTGPPLVIEFVVDANLEENCANVTLNSGEASADVILNVGAPTDGGTVCASGTLGTIPLTLAGEAGALGNAVVRMTVSENGFSDGLLGATVDGETAVTIATIINPAAAAVVAQVFDINDDLSGDSTAACNAISTAYDIGGTALPAAAQ